MKRLFIALFVLLLWLPLTAGAEEGLDVLLAAHPGAEALASAEGLNMLAAVLELPDRPHPVLCVAQKRDGAWTLAAEASKAFLATDTLISVGFDTDGETLFWQAQTDDDSEVTSWRRCSVYRPCDEDARVAVSIVYDYKPTTYIEGYSYEIQYGWQDGFLRRSSYRTDEDGNLVYEEHAIPLKLPQAEALFTLAGFDAESELMYDYHEFWPYDPAFKAQLAAELFPGCEYLGGCIATDWFQLLIRKASGDIVLECVTWDGQAYQIAESTPLPEGTRYAAENFESSLVIPGIRAWAVDVRLVSDGVWGTSGVWAVLDETTGEEMVLFLGRNWIGNETMVGVIPGTHPWADITSIDWLSLPKTWKEAMAALNTDGWAAVNNPDPADRLHLRTSPDRGAKSLGKYYNGTPVRVLDTKGDWTQVSVFGQTGWMMSKYLAFGEDLKQVTPAYPKMFSECYPKPLTVYADRHLTQALYEDTSDNIFAIGILGDEAYHIWTPWKDGAGYVNQQDLTPGNG